MKVGIDFKFRDDLKGGKKGDKQTVAIELLMEPYRGIIFRFTEVAVKEVKGEATMKFKYDLIDTKSYSMSKLKERKTFEKTLGLILNALLLDAFDDGVEEIETGNRNSPKPHQE